jgi:CRP-like cAMP-binding protein
LSILESGEVTLGRDENSALITLGPNDFFGEISLLWGFVTAFSNRRGEPLTLLALKAASAPAGRAALLNVFELSPRFALNMVIEMARRLAFAGIRDARHTVSERLRILLYLNYLITGDTDMDLSQERAAAFMGCSSRRASSALSALTKTGIIQRPTQGRVKILDRDALVAHLSIGPA